MRPITYTLPFPGRTTFIPLGCLHWPIGEKSIIQRWVDALARADGGFGILMGDTSDSARTHYRDHIRGYRSDSNSQIALDEWHKRDVAELAKTLAPIKGKLIGAILGNHYWEYADGTNSEQYLCQLLGIRYLGPTGIVRLEFKSRDGRVRHQMILYAHHTGGSMGGRTSGGDVNALERVEGSFEADIYCLSHTHRRYATRQPTLTLTRKGEPRLLERTKVFIRTGACLKGYGEDHPSTTKPHFPSYAESKAYRPTDLGFVTLTIDLHHEGHGGKQTARNNSILRPELVLSY